MRMHGHAAHDDMKYVPKEQVEEWRQKDPIDRQEARVREAGVDTAALREEVKQSIDAGTRGGARHADARPRHRHARLFHDEGDEILLGDGDAPWSGFAGGAS